ncbi:hypothetical protein BGX23_001158 [Mortierella sp. AD031]|nr:hypothetical protein BGX23_001158 [Mortierella sp. AD031]KAG0198190.1 hypothetical protein BGX33_012527 [Mortierella sp. NVP41]
MATSTHATVFDIHLLQEQICAELTLRDIRRCCLVSKDLYHNFSPYLYRTIPIHRKSTFNKFHRAESLAALARHHDKVLHVHSVFAQIWKTLLDHQCHNLVTLTSAHLPKRYSNRDQNRFQTEFITDLIEANPRLHSVEMSQFLFEPRVVYGFCAVVRNHAQLRELKIVSPNFMVRGVLVRQFLWSSVRLEKLHLDVQCYDFRLEGSEEPLEIEYQELLRLAGSKDPIFALKELTIPCRMYGHEANTALRLLSYTPHVERFVPFELDYGHQCEGLLRALSTTMTNIRHLDLQAFGGGVQGPIVVQILKLCHDLKSFVSSPLQNGIREVADVLCVHHRETLEELHMVGANRMTSRQVLAFLTECPRLQILDCMYRLEAKKKSLDREFMTRQRIGDTIVVLTPDMDPARMIPWVCSGLKVLKLRYETPTPYVRLRRGDADDHEEEEEVVELSDEWLLPKVLYAQINRMTELEILWLGRVEDRIPSDDSFMLALRVAAGYVPPELAPRLQPKSETEIRQEQIGTGNMSKALMAWRSLRRLRQVQLRNLGVFVDKDVVKEARRSWKDLEWISY